MQEFVTLLCQFFHTNELSKDYLVNHVHLFVKGALLSGWKAERLWKAMHHNYGGGICSSSNLDILDTLFLDCLAIKKPKTIYY